MDDQIEEDWLDARLRSEAPYIDDAGFSARVVAQLPVSRARGSMRAVILFATTLLASAIAYAVSDDGHFVAETFVRLQQLPLPLLALLALFCGLLVTAIGSFVAVAKAREQQSLGL